MRWWWWEGKPIYKLIVSGKYLINSSGEDELEIKGNNREKEEEVIDGKWSTQTNESSQRLIRFTVPLIYGQVILYTKNQKSKAPQV